MNQNNSYIRNIAQINYIDRFNAIVDVLKTNNIDYQIQNILGNQSLGNIIVKQNFSNDKKIVVSAHYDNVLGTPGANDNAAACAILLNLIIKLKDINKNIEFVFFDLEEQGFLGSNKYLKENQNNILYAINLDMCGIGENIVYSADNFDDDELSKISNIQDKYNCKKVNMLPPGDAYNFIFKKQKILYVINSTNNDLKYFENYYNNKMNFMNCDFVKTMHKPNDTIDNINFNQVSKIEDFIFELLTNL